MTTAELIAKLQEMPGHSPVGFALREGEPPFTVHAVTEVSHFPYFGMTGLTICVFDED